MTKHWLGRQPGYLGAAAQIKETVFWKELDESDSAEPADNMVLLLVTKDPLCLSLFFSLALLSSLRWGFTGTIEIKVFRKRNKHDSKSTWNYNKVLKFEPNLRSLQLLSGAFGYWLTLMTILSFNPTSWFSLLHLNKNCSKTCFSSIKWASQKQPSQWNKWCYNCTLLHPICDIKLDLNK